MSFPGGSGGKESACNAGDAGLIPGSGRRKWQPTPVILPGKSHGQRRLVGNSPWISESDATERLSVRACSGPSAAGTTSLSMHLSVDICFHVLPVHPL